MTPALNPALTARQIELIQRTYRKLAPIENTFSALFCKRLSDLDPALIALFNKKPSGRVRDRDSSLLQLIGTVVCHLDHIETLAPAVTAVGRYYFGCALKRDDYDLVGQALIWTLARCLEDDFTDEVKLAWLDAYSLLACVMEQSIRMQFGGRLASADVARDGSRHVAGNAGRRSLPFGGLAAAA